MPCQREKIRYTMNRTLPVWRWPMYKKLLLFLLIIVALVTALVYYDRNRANPWGSDVFFGSLGLITGV